MYLRLACSHVAEDDFELLILSLALKCWDCSHVPLCLVYAVLGAKLRTSYMVGKHITN